MKIFISCIGIRSNNLNQYTALTSGSITQTPIYDADGNMTLRDGWTQVWNGENRLIETYNETTKLTFSYDYMGRRIEKKVFQQTGGIWAPQKSLQYVYDGYKLVEEIDILPDEKPVLRRYTWQPETQGVDVPLVVTDVASNQNYSYTADANKNISELVDANGNTVAHYEYNPFGKITFQSGAYANNNPFQFSSEYFDTETGLVYYNYRYYSPQLGRWINKDPIQEKGGANLYGMVRNNIINLWDNWGLEVTAEAVISFDDFLKKMQDWEKQLDNNLSKKCPPSNKRSCKDKLQALRDQIHGNAPFSHSGSWSSGANPVDKTKLGWNYIYTGQQGWVDMGHFSNAAYYYTQTWSGFLGTFGVKLGGGAVEIGQLLSTLIPGFPTASKTSAFTQEDFFSNRLGAEFGKYVSNLKDCTSLTNAFKDFMNKYGPSNNPDISKLISSQNELDSGFWKYPTNIGRGFWNLIMNGWKSYSILTPTSQN